MNSKRHTTAAFLTLTAALLLSPMAAPAAGDKPGAAPIPTFDPLELDR